MQPSFNDDSVATLEVTCCLVSLCVCSVQPSPMEPEPEADMVETEPRLIPLLEVMTLVCVCTVPVIGLLLYVPVYLVAQIMFWPLNVAVLLVHAVF